MAKPKKFHQNKTNLIITQWWGFLQANLSLFLHHQHLKTSLYVPHLPFMVKNNQFSAPSNPKLWQFHMRKHCSFIMVLFWWILLCTLNNGFRAFQNSWEKTAQGSKGMVDFIFYIQDNGDLRKLPDNSDHNHHWEKTVSYKVLPLHLLQLSNNFFSTTTLIINNFLSNRIFSFCFPSIYRRFYLLRFCFFFQWFNLLVLRKMSLVSKSTLKEAGTEFESIEGFKWNERGEDE